jgi:hypothetical protein
MVAACNAAALAVWLGALRQRGAPAAWRFAWQWSLLNLVVLAAWLPWLPVVLDQTAHRLAHFWLPVPRFCDLRYAVMTTYGQPYLHAAQPLPDLLSVGLGTLGLWRHRANRVLLALALMLLAGVPLASFAISQWRPIMNGKTWEWLVPLFLILVAQGCAWNRMLALPGALLLGALQVSACFWLFAHRPDEAYPAVAAILARDTRPGDVLYTLPASNLILLRRYGFDTHGLRVLHPPATIPGSRPARRQLCKWTGWGGCLRGLGRVWVLTRGPPAGQASLMATLSPPAVEQSDQRFGHGRMRNLELSLVNAGSGGSPCAR